MWRQRGGSKYHTVVELTGNGTTYHLLCTPYSSTARCSTREADWDDETDELGQSPVYSRSGERVTEMEVL